MSWWKHSVSGVVADFEFDPTQWVQIEGPDASLPAPQQQKSTREVVEAAIAASKDKDAKWPDGEREEQRRSFAHGNCALHDPNITRELIDKVADQTPPQQMAEQPGEEKTACETRPNGKFWCNKCGYVGETGPLHYGANGQQCGYAAVEVQPIVPTEQPCKGKPLPQTATHQITEVYVAHESGSQMVKQTLQPGEQELKVGCMVECVRLCDERDSEGIGGIVGVKYQVLDVVESGRWLRLQGLEPWVPMARFRVVAPAAETVEKPAITEKHKEVARYIAKLLWGDEPLPSYCRIEAVLAKEFPDQSASIATLQRENERARKENDSVWKEVYARDALIATLTAERDGLKGKVETIYKPWQEQAISMLHEIRQAYAPGEVSETGGAKAISKLITKIDSLQSANTDLAERLEKAKGENERLTNGPSPCLELMCIAAAKKLRQNGYIYPCDGDREEPWRVIYREISDYPGNSNFPSQHLDRIAELESKLKAAEQAVRDREELISTLQSQVAYLSSVETMERVKAAAARIPYVPAAQSGEGKTGDALGGEGK